MTATRDQSTDVAMGQFIRHGINAMIKGEANALTVDSRADRELIKWAKGHITRDELNHSLWESLQPHVAYNIICALDATTPRTVGNTTYHSRCAFGMHLPSHVEGIMANDLITLASAIKANVQCPNH